MKSTAEDIKEIIETVLNGVFVLYPIVIGKEPDSPENIITIFETVGFPDQLAFNRNEKYEYPSVQIRVRGTNYVDAYQQGIEIKKTLHGRGKETWGGTFYSLIRCQNGPFLLDYDKNQNPRFVLNFNIQRY